MEEKRKEINPNDILVFQENIKKREMIAWDCK
jgi:hypothetical protein